MNLQREHFIIFKMLKSKKQNPNIWNIRGVLASMYLMVNISTSPAWKSEVFHFPPNLDVISNGSSVNQPVPACSQNFVFYIGN